MTGDVDMGPAAGTDAATDRVLIARTRTGWRVGTRDHRANGHVTVEEVPDLTSAMVLADLLAAEMDASSTQRRSDAKAGKTDTMSAATDGQSGGEVDRLRTTVAQLEHALGTRVTVEQAIGILAERQRVKPRRAFERLRQAARARGRRVHELAHEVVASTTNPLLPIPPELTRTPPT